MESDNVELLLQKLIKFLPRYIQRLFSLASSRIHLSLALMAIKWQGKALSFVCEVLCEIRPEVMRQRGGGRETVGETVGVKTSLEVLNMWGAKALAIAAVTKGALPQQTFHIVQMVLGEIWGNGVLHSNLLPPSLPAFKWWKFLCPRSCRKKKSASNASRGIKFERNLYDICNSTNPCTRGTENEWGEVRGVGGGGVLINTSLLHPVSGSNTMKWNDCM